MPRIISKSTKTVRDFIIRTGVPTRRGDHEILMELTECGFYDGVEMFVGDHVDRWEPELTRFCEMIKSITSIKDLTKIRWNAWDSELYSDPDGMQCSICPPSYEEFGASTMHLKVEDCSVCDQFHLEAWWDKTGAIIHFDNGPCAIELIYYNVD